MKPYFSIIVPVYNVAPYLRECLDSVLAQTFTDWEAICVDDGSTDGGGAILDEYAVKDKRFRVMHQQNAGVSVARNQGLAVAKGKWIWFVDSDDCIRQGSLAVINQALDNNQEVDVVKIRVAREPFAQGVDIADTQLTCRSIERSATNFWRYRCGAYYSVMSRSCIHDLRFVPKMAIGEDSLFHILAYYRFKTELIISEPLYYYRERDNSAMKRQHTVRMVRDWMGMHMRMLRVFRDKGEASNPAMRHFLKWNSSYVFFTDDRAFFKLPLSEMKQCYGAWLKLVKMADELAPHTWWKRPLIWLFAKVRMPLIAKWTVLWICKVRGL